MFEQYLLLKNYKNAEQFSIKFKYEIRKQVCKNFSKSGSLEKNLTRQIKTKQNQQSTKTQKTLSVDLT